METLGNAIPQENSNIRKIMDLTSGGSSDNFQGDTEPIDQQQSSVNTFFIQTKENVVYKHVSEPSHITINRFAKRNGIQLELLNEKAGYSHLFSVLFNKQSIGQGKGTSLKLAKKKAYAAALEELKKYFNIIQINKSLNLVDSSDLNSNEKSISVSLNDNTACGGSSNNFQGDTKPVDVQQFSANSLEKTCAHAATVNTFFHQTTENVLYKCRNEQPQTTVLRFTKRNNIKLDSLIKKFGNNYLCSVFFNKQLIKQSTSSNRKNAKRQAFAAVFEELKKYCKVIKAANNYEYPSDFSNLDSNEKSISVSLNDNTASGGSSDNFQDDTEPTNNIQQSSANTFFIQTKENVLYKHGNEPPLTTINRFAKRNSIKLGFFIEKVGYSHIFSVLLNKQSIGQGQGASLKMAKKKAYAVALEELKKYFNIIQVNKSLNLVGSSDFNSNKKPTSVTSKHLSNENIDLKSTKSIGGMVERPSSEILQEESYDKDLPPNNVGSKLMKLMGWTGGGLGKHSQGITEPISVNLRKRRVGLGLDAKVKKCRKLVHTSVDNKILSQPFHDSSSLDKKTIKIREQPELSCDIVHLKPKEEINVLEDKSFVTEPAIVKES